MAERCILGHEGYENWRAFIRKVDNPDEDHGISEGNWSKEYNDMGFRKHLTSIKDGRLVLDEERLAQYQRVLLPTLRKELERIPMHDRDKSHSSPWMEVGLTVNPISRMKEHRNHSKTTPGLAFLECVSLAKYGGIFSWIYQPIARAREAEHLPWLESCFSMLLQSYFHLGGVNIEPAGISMNAAHKMGLKDKAAACDKLNIDTFDQNISWTLERFGNLEIVMGNKK